MKRVKLRQIIKEEIQHIFEEEKKQFKVYLKDLMDSVKNESQLSVEEIVKHLKKLKEIKPQIERKVELVKKQLKTKDGNWVQTIGIPMKKSSETQLKQVTQLINIFSEKQQEQKSEVSDVDKEKINKYLRAIINFSNPNKIKKQISNLKLVINAANLDLNIKKVNEIINQLLKTPNIEEIKNQIKQLLIIINK
jgi:hypothetical protein